jgi:hypothetical protein
MRMSTPYIDVQQLEHKVAVDKVIESVRAALEQAVVPGGKTARVALRTSEMMIVVTVDRQPAPCLRCGSLERDERGFCVCNGVPRPEAVFADGDRFP